MIIINPKGDRGLIVYKTRDHYDFRATKSRFLIYKKVIAWWPKGKLWKHL